MRLNIAERVHLLPLLPQQGNFATLKILHNLRLELSFDEVELAEAKMTEQAGKLHWPDSDAVVKEIQIGPRARTVIVDALQALDRAKSLTLAQLPLYEKFVELTGEPDGAPVEPPNTT